MVMKKLAAWLRSTERRANRRQRGNSVRISVAGRQRAVLDWSLGGFRIEAGELRLARGDRLEGSIEYRGCRGEFGAEVLQAGDGQLSARFLDITPRVLLALSGLAER